jgi:hypothetical protein
MYADLMYLDHPDSSVLFYVNLLFFTFYFFCNFIILSFLPLFFTSVILLILDEVVEGKCKTFGNRKG